MPPGHRGPVALRGGRDQFIRIEQGPATVEFGRIDGRIEGTYCVEDLAIVAGIWHNVVNTGTGDLKLYSSYSPPEHPAGTIHHTKA